MSHKRTRPFDSQEDTKDEGDHGSQTQSHPEVSHPVVEGGHSHSVGQHTLQAHKQQPCWKCDTSPHIMKRFGVVHLPYRNMQSAGGALPRSQCLKTFTPHVPKVFAQSVKVLMLLLRITWKLPTMTRPTALAQPLTRALVLIQHWWLCSITWA